MNNTTKSKKGLFITLGVGAVAILGVLFYFFVLPIFSGKEQVLSGLQLIDGERYFYSEKGTMESGLREIEGKLYYFDPSSGKAISGWFTDPYGDVYYFGKDGYALTGQQEIEGKLYQFGEDGRLAIEADPAGFVWETKDNKIYCKNPDGEYVTGLAEVDGALYFFAEDGARQSGWQTIEGGKYYFSPANGRAAKGWFSEDGKSYYFGENGIALVGQQTIDGKPCTFDEEGRLVADKTPASNNGGKKPASSSVASQGTSQPASNPDPAPTPVGFRWDTDANGNKKCYNHATGQYLTGRNFVDGAWYVFDTNGGMQTGWKETDGKKAFYDTTTGKALIASWKKGEGADAPTYYLGNDGFAVTGLQTIGTDKYGFDAEGKQVTGLLVMDGGVYCFTGEAGKAIQGWYPQEPTAAAARSARIAEDSAYYYFGTDYAAVTGVSKIGDKYYMFSKMGVQARGWQEIANKIYNFDGPSGEALLGWQSHEGKNYFMGAEGCAVSGIVQDNGLKYYFGTDFAQETGWRGVNGATYCFEGENGAALVNQFKADGDKNYYLGAEGAALTGLQSIGPDDAKKLYYFDSYGVQTHGWQLVGGKYYLFSEDDGTAQYGWQVKDNGNAYIGAEGYALTGLQTIKNATTQQNEIFYFSGSGMQQTGWQQIEKKRYLFDGDAGSAHIGEYVDGPNVYHFGADGAALTGVQALGADAEKALYYFDTETGVRKTGWQIVAKELYYFDTVSAKAHIGWYTDYSTQGIYYFGEDGKAYTGTKEITGIKYVFDSNGRMKPEDEGESAWVTNNGVTQYVGADGKFVTGLKNIAGSLYYFDAKGARQTGFTTINEKNYFFDTETGTAVIGFYKYNNKQYYFGNEGFAVTGLQILPVPDAATSKVSAYSLTTANVKTALFYFDSEGVMLTGEQNVEGMLYYFDATKGGAAVTGWYPAVENPDARYYGEAYYALTGLQHINGNIYLFTDGGIRKTGWQTEQNRRYYFDSEGKAVKGEFTENGSDSYYFGDEGHALVGKQVIGEGENAAIYYFDAQGLRQYKWQRLEGGRYYFAPGSGKAQIGRFVDTEDNDAVYYFAPEGYALTGSHIMDGGVTRVFDQDGKMQSEKATIPYRWLERDGKWYYEDSTGAHYTGMHEIEEAWYYFDPATGARLSGPITAAMEEGGTEKLYYFSPDDGKALRGWYTNAEGHTYYLDPTEYFAWTGEHTINKREYSFDEEGRLEAGQSAPVFNAWNQQDGKFYYIDSSGEYVVGLHMIDGAQYYFDSNGVRTGGYQEIDNGFYYFNGKDANGVEDNRALTGWNFIESGSEEGAGRWVCLAANTGRQETGWVYRKTEEGLVESYYFYADGTSPQGFVTLNNTYRYFFEGKMLTGLQTITTEEGTYQYYFYTDSGAMAKGVVDINGTLHSFDENGRLITGWNTDDAGNRYYFGAEGIYKGWQKFAESEGAVEKWYHFDETTGRQLLGWQVRTEGTKTYQHYYDEAGASPEGFGVVNGVYRYFYPEGYMAIGWTELTRTGAEGEEPVTEVFYFHATGEMAKGSVTLGSIVYNFGDNGVLPQGWVKDSAGKQYYYTPAGALTGWQDDVEGRTIYFHEANAYQMTGLQTRQNPAALYYYNEDGTSPSEEWVTPTGKNYKIYVFANGRVPVGWETVEGIERYFYADGHMATGVSTVDGAIYSFDDEGRVITGWNTDKDGKRYYFTANGVAKGWNQIEENGVQRWYVFDETTGAQLTGMQARNTGANGVTKWYYYSSSGQLPAAGWNEGISGKKRYVLADGELAQGWQALPEGRSYFLPAEPGVAASGWFEVDRRWYVSDTAGVQLTGWQTRNLLGNTTGYYYYDENGALPPAGWTAPIEGSVRYALPEGMMAQGWKEIDKYNYYFNEEGKYHTGELTLNGALYTFDDQGRYIGPPSISSVTFNNSVWEATKAVTVTAQANVLLADKTLLYSFDSGITWQLSNVKGGLTPNSVLKANSIRVKDSMGNITTYSAEIKLTNPFDKMRGIDVSSHQGDIDWKAVADSGIEYVIVRSLTWSGNYYAIDSKFEYNVRQAKAYGLKVGTYLFTYAFNETEMLEEISFFMNSPEIKRLMADKIYFDMPVYIDYEYTKLLEKTPYAQRAQVIQYGMVLIEQLSKKMYGNLMLPGFYMSTSWALYNVNAKWLQDMGYEFWIAHWDAPAHTWPYTRPTMWQYTVAPAGTVPGINTRIDMNYCYKDYSGILNSGVKPPPISSHSITVYDLNTKTTVSGPAESILAQIVMNEVGGFSSPEVFKAQAVAAQAWIRYQNSQGYMAPSVGLKSPSSAVQQAVKEVVKQNLVYNGQQAFTPYYAYSAGKTNDNTYWGNNLPYLQSVDSGNDASRPAVTVTITEDAMKKRLEEVYNSSITSGKDPSTWIQITGSNAAGYVTRLNVCGRTPTVDYFYQTIVPTTGGKRPIMSPHFTVTYNASARTFTFTSRGWGHGVGMSQEGANDMAKSGYTYKQILAHYFPGTSLVDLY